MNPQVIDRQKIDDIIENDKFLKEYCKKNNITDYRQKELLIENRRQLILSKNGKDKTPTSGVIKVESSTYHLIFNKYDS